MWVKTYFNLDFIYSAIELNLRGKWTGYFFMQILKDVDFFILY